MPGIIAIGQGGSYVDLPMPSVYQVTPNEIVKADRNVEANMSKERINIKRSIILEWNMLMSADSTKVAQLTSGNSFSVKYFDPETKAFMYGTFYRGDDYEHEPLHTADSWWTGTSFKRWRMSMSLVEL